jgi:hypothetical protein
MSRLQQPVTRLLAAAALLTTVGAQAMPTQVTVTIENLAPASGVAFAPLHLAFNNGSYDAFNLGQVAGAAIVSVAEGGAGGAWQAAFAAADPGAVRGTVGGALFAGASASASYMVDGASNPFFTFAAMAMPSNDFFIGNDNPMAYQLFNAAGQLQISSITRQGARDLGRRLRGVRPRCGGLRRQQRPAHDQGRWWPSTSPSLPATTACRPRRATPSTASWRPTPMSTASASPQRRCPSPRPTP